MITEQRFKELSNRIHNQLEQAMETGTESQKINASLMLEYIEALYEGIKTRNGLITGHQMQLKKLSDSQYYYDQMIAYRAILRTFGCNPDDQMKLYKKSAAAHGAFN